MSVLAAVLGVPGDYPTFQAAVDAAADGDVVLVSEGTYTGAGNVDIALGDRSITIEGLGSGATIRCGSNEELLIRHRGFWIESTSGSAASIVIRNIEIREGAPHVDEIAGGAILAFGGATVTIDGCRFIENGTYYSVTRFGGAISAGPGTFLVKDCFFNRNTAESGDCVYLTGSADLVVQRCQFEDNWGGFGSITADAGRALIEQCVFLNGGRAIGARGGPLTLRECLLINNSADYGGAIEVGNDVGPSPGECVLEDCVVAANRANRLGGAVLVAAGTFRAVRTIIYGNCAAHGTQNGQDVFVDSGSAEFECSDVSANGVYGNATFDRCIRVDPMFCDPNECSGPGLLGDYRLQPGSPCLASHSPCGQDIGGPLGVCVVAGTGACCLADASCVIVSEAECAAAGGVYYDGVECDQVTCAPPIAVIRSSWGTIKRRYQ